MIYSAIIVEDELHQQEALSKLLGEFSDFQIGGIASTLSEAKQLLISVKPQLVFMDVMLGKDNSFDLLAELDHIPFNIIFVTAFNEYAVRAFRLSAIDYLMKPAARHELDEALKKFKLQKESEQNLKLQNLIDNYRRPLTKHKIALPTLSGLLFVEVKDIVRCESDNTYTTFFTLNKQKIVVSKTLKEVEQMLTEREYRFFRVHNSHLINLDYVTEYMRGEGGTVKMSDGSQIDVSRRRKDEVLALLKK